MTSGRVMARRVPAALLLACTLAMAQPVAAPVSATTACSPEATTSPDVVWQLAGRRLSALLPGTGFPFGATGDSPYRRTTARTWTSGFFPASLWLLYAQTGAATDLAAARRLTTAVLPVSRWNGTHDLGFMVGLPAGLGMQLDPDPLRQTRYRTAAITAAKSLSTRWNPRVAALKSADYDGTWGLIIDSAMNAPLLIRAGQWIGGAQGKQLVDRGTRHMATLAKNLLRANGSTIHRFGFDARTGRALGPLPGQGLNTRSTWARGQAWAMNGFTQAFALTSDDRFLIAARSTADYWIAHVPAGCVPAWDLDLTRDTAQRDTSAAAIAADALLRLAAVDPDAARSERWRTYADTSLSSLVDARWVSRNPSALGVLQHQAYSIPLDPRDGTYVWGDTYLLCALSTSGRQYTSIC